MTTTVSRRTPPPATPPTRGALARTITGVGRPLAWSALLAAAHAVLTAAGRVLPAPPLAPRAFLATIAGTDPVLTAFGLLRLLALGLTWYLAAVTAVAIVARLTHCRPLAVLADRVAVPALRVTLHRVLGAGLALSVAGGVAPLATVPSASASPAARIAAVALAPDAPATADGPSVPSQVTMHRLPDAPDARGAPAEPTPPTPPGTVRMRLVPEDSEPEPSVPSPLPSDTTVLTSTDATTTSTPSEPHAPGATPAEPASPRPPTAADAPSPPLPSADATGGSPAGAADTATETAEPTASTPTTSTDSTPMAATWTIAPGDHLWHVATATLEAQWARPPTNAEILAYVHALIERNRDVLVVRDNPDLVLPGQVFTLPEVPAAA
jgi:hypothetical protein